MTGATPIRDAATIILLRRQAEGVSVLMGMRGAGAVFMPSKYVFPGGAVDPGDASAPLTAPLAEPHRSRLVREPRPGTLPDPDAIAAAALRELAEETGQLIGRPGHSTWPGFAEAGLCPDASALVYLFRAITPPGRPRRFDAHFFVADAACLATDPDDFSRACDELSHLHWVPLAEARALDLPFITEVVLAELADLIAGLPQDACLPVPDTVPFFDNRTPAPRFAQIA
ncbi:NUDIX domain-containing protein [Paracoccus benzoatiresistens]|uniref:DNA mismatch repair protein MutT n=1 Tax=Paracoccus benzoatiresistens TaxID=2997341 RepID=A0ABT4J536_9RHOB|nr:NUDIX domain-containing protein [Paracoccus sp. EF6]MCZ0962203.1 DNA mismatch repair protein MutT [Paracoccus sp. EF6]